MAMKARKNKQGYRVYRRIMRKWLDSDDIYIVKVGKAGIADATGSLMLFRLMSKARKKIRKAKKK